PRYCPLQGISRQQSPPDANCLCLRSRRQQDLGNEQRLLYCCCSGRPLSKLLFNRNAFREIAWLVDIGALADGGMVSKELDRDRVKQRRDKRVAARQRDTEGEAVGEASDPGSVRDHHDAAAAGHDLLDIAEGLFEEVV